jgi:hypothetical protein
MFTLGFIVMFNIKKGSIVAYKSGWSGLLTNQVALLINLTKEFSPVSLMQSYIYRFQFTTVTSRATSYMLFFF